jgi:hypothetical protein
MRRNVRLFIVSLIVAGCAGSVTPAPIPQPIKQLPPNVRLTGTPLGDGQRVGDYTVWLTSATVPTRGVAQLEAVVLDKENKPVTDATVSFDVDMTNMSHGKNVLQTNPMDAGHYTGNVRFMMGGPWRVIVVIQRPNQTPVSARFNFNVR